MRSMVTLIFIMVMFLSLSGCRSIHLGGSGGVGGIHGSGGVSIPLPK